MFADLSMKFLLEKIRLSSSATASEMRLAQSYFGEPVSTFLMRQNDHSMTHCVFSYRLSKTSLSSMEEETVRCKWLLLVLSWLRMSRERKL